MRQRGHMFVAGLVAMAIAVGLATPSSAADHDDQPWWDGAEIPPLAQTDGEQSPSSLPNSLQDGVAESGTHVSPTFIDVGPSDQFADEVAWLVSGGIAEGYDDGSYRPTAPITRQAFAAFLYRLDGSPDSPECVGEGPFPDVSSDHPFCKEILWLSTSGITAGYTDGSFRPLATISRQAVSAFLNRYTFDGSELPTCGENAKPFSDVETGDPFCGVIRWMATVGPETLAKGYDDGSFRPTAPVSRQAIAAYLYRYRQYAPQERDIFEYQLNEGTVEIDAGDLEAVEREVLAEMVVNDQGTMVTPEQSQWHVTYKVGIEPEPVVGQNVFLHPDNVVGPGGFAGTVADSFMVADDQYQLTVVPGDLNEIFGELLIQFDGLVEVGDTAPASLGLASQLSGGQLPDGASAPSGGFSSFSGCKAKPTGDVFLPVISLDIGPRVHVDLHIGGWQGQDSYSDIWVGVETNMKISFTTDEGLGWSCEKTIPSVPIPLANPALTLSIAPRIELDVSIGAAAVSVSAGSYVRVGSKWEYGKAPQPYFESGSSPVVADVTVSASLSLKFGPVITVSFMYMVGLYGFIGPKRELAIEATVAFNTAGLTGLEVCLSDTTSLSIEVGVSIGLKLGFAMITLGEFDLFEGDVVLFGSEHCWQIFNGKTTASTVPSQYSAYAEYLANGGSVTAPSPDNSDASITYDDPDWYSNDWTGNQPPGSGQAWAPEEFDLGDGGFAGPALDTNPGKLWTMGWSTTGATGVDPTLDPTVPHVLDIDGTVEKIIPCSIGGQLTGAITTDGTLWIWGDDKTGQYGDGDPYIEPEEGEEVPWDLYPRAVPLANVKNAFFDIRCDRVWAVTDSGAVYGWGKGGLGVGDALERLAPTLIPELHDVVQIESNDNAIIAREADGDLYGWGNGDSGVIAGAGTGQLLTPVLIPGVPPVRDIKVHLNGGVIAASTDGDVWRWGEWTYPLPYYSYSYTVRFVPFTVATPGSVVDVDAKFGTYFAITDEGTLLSWGVPYHDFLGRPDSSSLSTVQAIPRLPPITKLIIKTNMAVALAEDGTVWTWGGSGSDLGQGPLTEGRLPGNVAGLTDVVDIATGEYFSSLYALKSNGQVWAWGENWVGQLGDGSVDDQSRPQRVDYIGNVTDIQASVAWVVMLAGD